MNGGELILQRLRRLHRETEQGDVVLQKRRTVLLRAVERHRQGGLSRVSGLVVRQRSPAPLAAVRLCPPQGGQLFQRIPPQGVELGRRGHQPLVRLGGQIFHIVGRAAGLAQPLNGLLPGGGALERQLGTVPLRRDRVRPVGEGEGQRLLPAHDKLAADAHQRVLPAIVRPGGGKQLLRRALVRPHTEHLPPGAVPEIAVAESLTGKGQPQLLQFFLCRLPPLPDGGGVDAGDDGDVLRPLHPSLDLDAGHAHLVQLLQMTGQRHILQGQQRAVRLVAPAVAQAAGLGAQAAVAAPAADDGGEKALAGVAHALRAVNKGLDLNGGVGADVGDLVGGQLPRQHRPGAAQVGALAHAVEVHHAHLSAGMDGHVGGGAADKVEHA